MKQRPVCQLYCISSPYKRFVPCLLYEKKKKEKACRADEIPVSHNIATEFHDGHTRSIHSRVGEIIREIRKPMIPMG